MSLKQLEDGLLKVFKVQQSVEPFYSGGKVNLIVLSLQHEIPLHSPTNFQMYYHTKVEVSKDETKIACLYENNVKFISLGANSKM